MIEPIVRSDARPGGPERDPADDEPHRPPDDTGPTPGDGERPSPGQLLAALVVVYGLMVGAAFLWLSWRGRTEVIGQWALGSHGAAVAVGSGTAVGLAFFFLSRLLVRYVRAFAALDARLADLIGPVDDKNAVLIALVSGTAEEFFFRCAMQDAVGPLIAAAVFGLAHLGGRGLRLWSVQATLFGLALGGLVHFGCGVLAAALAHALFNYLWLQGNSSR